MTSPRLHLSRRLKLGVASGLIAGITLLASVGTTLAFGPVITVNPGPDGYSSLPISSNSISVVPNFAVVTGPTTGTLIVNPQTNQAFILSTTTAGTYTVTYSNGYPSPVLTVSGPLKASVTLTRGAVKVTQTLASPYTLATTGTATFAASAFPR
jgi:hypothetical protein